MLPPRIDTSRLKHPVLAKLGNPVTLTVDVSGYPPPSVRWYIGRRELRDGNSCQLTVDGRRYVLHVEEVTDDLARGVTVIAANSVGVVTSEIPVKVYKVFRSQNFLQRSISQTLRSPDSVVLQRRRKLRLIRPGQSLSSFGSFSSFQYDYNVSRTFSERPRRPSTASSLLSEGSAHWPPACSPRNARRVFDFELQNLPSSPPSGRRYMSSGDPDVSFECIQEPSERTIGGRRPFIKSDAVFDEVGLRAPIASTPEVNTLDLSPTPPARESPPPPSTEVTPARIRTVRSKPPPAPPKRSSSLVSSPTSTATECTASTQRSPRLSTSPSPHSETNGVIPSTPEGVDNRAFHPSVSLEKQVSEFFEPTAMEQEGDDNDDIWKLMGFKLSELCRVMLKEPEETEDEPTEEREVKPLSKSTAAEPIQERQSQRVSAFSRPIPPTNMGASVTCVRGGSTGEAAGADAAASSADELTNRVKHDRTVAFGRTEPAIDGQSKPVAFVSPFTATESSHERDEMPEADDRHKGATTDVVPGRLAGGVSNDDTATSKAGEEVAYPFVWQNDAVGRTPLSVAAAVVADSQSSHSSRPVSVGGDVGVVDGDKTVLSHTDSVRVNNTKSKLKKSKDTSHVITQQGVSNGGGVISSRSVKKQKSTKSREGKEKKKSKKPKKAKEALPRASPSDTGPVKASDGKILRGEVATTSIIPTESTSIYAVNDSHDVMYSEGIIDISTSSYVGGRDLSTECVQGNDAEENRPLGGAAVGVGRSSEVEEILQHKEEVDRYVREIETQHYLTYGGTVAATSDVSKSDVITNDGPDLNPCSDSLNDSTSIHSNGSSTVATTSDVTTSGECETKKALPDSCVNPVRRPARTKKGKLRQIVALNRGCEEHQVVEIQVVPASFGRTDIEALIESTEAINVDALIDESLRQCLSSMTDSRPDYRPYVEGQDADTRDERGNAAVGGVEKKGESDEVKDDRDKTERLEENSSLARVYERDATQEEPRPGLTKSPMVLPITVEQSLLTRASMEELGETDIQEVRSPSDGDKMTDVVGAPVHAGAEIRRTSESLSDDIVFEEGFRVDDARELEMDAVSDEISLASFNTVIAVEAVTTSTEPKLTDPGSLSCDVMQTAELLHDNHSLADREAATEVRSADDIEVTSSTTQTAADVNTMSVTIKMTTDAGTADGMTDASVERNGDISTDNKNMEKAGHAYTRSSSLPQSERSERFECEVRNRNRSTATVASPQDSPPLSRSQSERQIDRCESFECEVRKQLQRPGVNADGPPFDDACRVTDELRTESPLIFSRDSITPESDNSPEVELKIVESDDDGDTAAVVATSRDTHARLYTLENTSEDCDFTRSHDNSDSNGLNHEESESDRGSDYENEATAFSTVDTREKTAREKTAREKTARAPVGDIIAFNDNLGNSQTHTYSSESTISSQTEKDSDFEDNRMASTDVYEPTDVMARNGDDQNDVVTDDETNIVINSTTDDIDRHFPDERRDDVSSISDSDGTTRGNETVFGADATCDRHGKTIPHGCTNMVTPTIVITDCSDQTPGGASYDGTSDIDDYQSRSCDINIGENSTSENSVGENDHRCEPDINCIDDDTTKPSHVDDEENRWRETESSKQHGARNKNDDVEMSTTDSEDAMDDNMEDNAPADLAADDVSETEMRQRHVGASGEAATTSQGATAAERTPRQTVPELTNPPEGVAGSPHQPEAASAMVSRHGQDFLSDLLVEKACLEGFFSNIGTFVFLLLAVFIFHLMDIFSRNYSPD